MPEEEVIDTAAEEAAFASGFNNVAGIEAPAAPAPVAAPVADAAPAPATTPAATPAPPAAPAVEPDAAALEAIADDDPPIIPGYTREQIANLLAQVGEVGTLKKSLASMSGHLGTVLEQVKGLKEAKAEVPPKMTQEQLTEYAELNPDTAAFLEQKLSGVAPGADVLARLSAAEARNVELARQLEERTINILHPDWAQTVASNGYKLWLATQSEADQKTALETESAMELAPILTAYRTFTGKQVRTQANKQRLEEALVPTGVPAQRPAELTEEDAFKAGFLAITGKR